jgi:heat-inducible transcriptional repressor
LISQELQILTNFLNHQLQGRSLSDLATLDWRELDREFQHYAHLLTTVLTTLKQRITLTSPHPILIGGLAKVLRQPEFAEFQQAQPLIHLLEEKSDQLWPLICEWSLPIGTPISAAVSNTLHGKRVKVWIGSENPLVSMHSCALVSSTYQKGETPVGSVGILGPTRMAYEKIIALVEATANYLSNCLSQPA